MSELPFVLPKSLVSYAEHFEQEPERATARLKAQLKKRGPDAVGHFLLAWFYHLNDENDKAVEEALKAKIYAPGSPFFKNLHYYLVHPKLFEAWTPDTASSGYSKSSGSDRALGPVLNLDALIERLAEAESERITPPIDKSDDVTITIAEEQEDSDDIVTETLANIHETQGKTEAAIRTYKRLSKLNKEKKDFYEEKILRLQKLQDKEEREEE